MTLSSYQLLYSRFKKRMSFDKDMCTMDIKKYLLVIICILTNLARMHFLPKKTLSFKFYIFQNKRLIHLEIWLSGFLWCFIWILWHLNSIYHNPLHTKEKNIAQMIKLFFHWSMLQSHSRWRISVSPWNILVVDKVVGSLCWLVC